MTADDSRTTPEKPAAPEGRTIADAGRIAEARSILASVDKAMFPAGHDRSRAEHRSETMQAIAGFFGHG